MAALWAAQPSICDKMAIVNFTKMNNNCHQMIVRIQCQPENERGNDWQYSQNMQLYIIYVIA